VGGPWTEHAGHKSVRKDTQTPGHGKSLSQNQDIMRKVETWGMMDRGEDVITRCQCNQCGNI
jgi:hypothetical protein